MAVNLELQGQVVENIVGDQGNNLLENGEICDRGCYLIRNFKLRLFVRDNPFF